MFSMQDKNNLVVLQFRLHDNDLLIITKQNKANFALNASVQYHMKYLQNQGAK